MGETDQLNKKLKMGNQWTDKWDFDATYAK